VLDTSALLAVLNREPGLERVVPMLDGALMSAVNWSETFQKAAMYRLDAGGLRSDVEELGVTLVPYTLDDAEETARLWPATRTAGLSLGDRACLALAIRQALPAVTADTAWANLSLGVDVQVIR
jgi:ribonuclease VapC